MQEITINLDLPPNQRWDFAVDYRNEINELIACYQKDIEDYEALFEEYLVVFKTQIPAAYLEEIKCIAKYCDYNENQVLFANLYYAYCQICVCLHGFCILPRRGYLACSKPRLVDRK